MKFLPLMVILGFQLFPPAVLKRYGSDGLQPFQGCANPVWVTLKGDPSQVQYLVKKRVHSEEEEVARWIRLLDSDSFRKRIEAESSLLRKGPGIIPILERSLTPRMPEAYLRTRRIIKKLWVRSW